MPPRRRQPTLDELTASFDSVSESLDSYVYQVAQVKTFLAGQQSELDELREEIMRGDGEEAFQPAKMRLRVEEYE